MAERPRPENRPDNPQNSRINNINIIKARIIRSDKVRPANRRADQCDCGGDCD